MNLPEPLTPPGCDLASHTYFPLHYDRLLRSKWWRRATDFARSRNVDLWAHAFREIPSASLPNDDADLAEMAGFGRDVATFQRAKAEILEPWVLCSDGRWYHPTLSEVACELWDRMDGKRRANRERQNARRDRIRQARVTQNEVVVTRDTPPMSRVTGGSEEGGVTLKTGDVTRFSGPKERKGDLGSNEPVASAAPSATDEGSKPWKSDPEFMALWEAATPEMRRRAKSMAKVWPEWKRARRTAAGKTVLGGMLGYLDGDPDVKRTGGPGLHIWLKDRTWEAWAKPDGDLGASWSDERWAAAVDIWRETQRWDERLGSAPGQPGCRAPPHLLITPTANSEVA